MYTTCIPVPCISLHRLPEAQYMCTHTHPQPPLWDTGHTRPGSLTPTPDYSLSPINPGVRRVIP
ncbi:unnamed protein product [Oppiella nova]|uniref:Uncharacterized protein n=1 Tax=Oppiella nova TaxID=334625 RepID=A0A7R9MR71_9ACAR|nr:unnamed protein product [Oppiella nova]CAG2182170.1 unnamed protein product [Oppiella nova]